MSIDVYFTCPASLRRLREGPLGAYADLIAKRLLSEGHSLESARRNLRVVCDLGHWMRRRRVRLGDLDERIIERYQRFRSRYGSPATTDRAALLRFLAVLRQAQAVAPKPLAVLGPLEQTEQNFYRYLTQECGLAHETALRHQPILGQFLQERCPQGPQNLSLLKAADVTAFVERHSHDRSSRSAQMMCWTLRSFLRYLRYQGMTSSDLTSCVPAVRTWRLASLPSYLHPREVQLVLAACDRHSPIGRRDYAILLLLSRLGLRANEIRLLTLDDIDWESGRLNIRGKGRRVASMPLPKEVGAAMAEYLRHGRPKSDSRRVFLRCMAPRGGFVTSKGISDVANSALSRAGVRPAGRGGAHLFRHSLATQMLRAGASLTEIGQVLRHQNPDTTRIYAKVDLSSLRAIALRWPGGTR
jgi:site-specific recombinase XerD